MLTKSWQKIKKKDRKGKTSKEEDLDQKIKIEKGHVLEIKTEKDKEIVKEKKNTKNMTSMIVMIMTEEEIDDDFQIFNCFLFISKYKNL